MKGFVLNTLEETDIPFHVKGKEGKRDAEKENVCPMDLANNN